MKLEIEIVSNENIRPSSPTPLAQKTYKLSMLDQVVPPMLVPVVLYFPLSSTKIDPQILKNSLSVLLTRFYPLAGRTNEDGLSVDCNDEGVPFTVTNVKGHKLSDLLKNPDPELPRFLLPCEVTWDSKVGPHSSVAMIQVNYFDCGGIAIGAVFCHKIADGTTIGTFMSSWANTTRGVREPVCPNYIAHHLFPQKEELGNQSESLGDLMKRGKSIMRRYVFNPSTISKLKAESNVDRPTRVEVVTALLWNCFITASLANNHKLSLLTHAVNLRRRAQPPFPSDCFGNFPGLAVATAANQPEKDLGQLVTKMRAAVSKIDGDYVDRMHGEDGLSGYYKNLAQIWSDVSKEADLFCISSWCGFNLYGIDFGWGKPVWITRLETGNIESKSPFMNGVWLMDTRNGDGVEAWVILDEKYMDIFDNIEKLRNVAIRDPSPLDTATILIKSDGA